MNFGPPGVIAYFFLLAYLLVCAKKKVAVIRNFIRACQAGALFWAHYSGPLEMTIRPFYGLPPGA